MKKIFCFLICCIVLFSGSNSLIFAKETQNLLENEASKMPCYIKGMDQKSSYYSWWYPEIYRSAKEYVVQEVWNNEFWLVDLYISGNRTFDINRVFDRIYASRSTMDYYNGYLWGYYYWDVLYNEYYRLYYIIRDSFLGSWYWEFNGTYFYNLQNDFCYGYLW